MTMVSDDDSSGRQRQREWWPGEPARVTAQGGVVMAEDDENGGLANLPRVAAQGG